MFGGRRGKTRLEVRILRLSGPCLVSCASFLTLTHTHRIAFYDCLLPTAYCLLPTPAYPNTRIPTKGPITAIEIVTHAEAQTVIHAPALAMSPIEKWPEE